MELTVSPLLTCAFEPDAIRQLKGKLPHTVLHTLSGFKKKGMLRKGCLGRDNITNLFTRQRPPKTY